MTEVSKSLEAKKQIKNVLDLGDKNREKIKQLETFDLSYIISKSDLDDDGSQNCLVFKPIFKYF